MSVAGRAPWIVGVGVAGSVAVASVLANLDLFGADIHVWGDNAANSLLIDEALRGRLLVGHYSRGGFNHPGPAFLYVQALGELVAFRWTGSVASAYGGWIVGVIALNASLLGWIASIVHRRTRSLPSALLLPVLALLVNAWEPSVFVNDWGPTVIVVPFLLVLVAGTFVTAGSYDELTPFAVGLGLIVHGHLSSVLFALGALLVAAGATFLHRRATDTWRPPTRRQWLPAAAVLAAFALPMFLHVLVDWPGELGGYVGYARGNAGATSGTPSEVLGFVRSIVAGGAPRTVAVVAALVVVLVLRPRLRGSARRLADAGSVMLGVQLGLFVVFAWRAVDDLSLAYLGWFAFALPVTLLWLAAAACLEVVRSGLGQRWHLGVGLTAAALIVGVAATTVDLGNRNFGIGAVGDMARVVAEDPTRLVFEHPDWPIAVGVLAGAQRAGGEVCVQDDFWAFMVTEDLICDPGSEARVVRVEREAEPGAAGADDLFRGDGLVLRLDEPGA